ncbi:MAG: nucleotidyltransferase family protein [Proteobacteria bacterium]|nr:nucleotidyltransferase family protein [Pseudomonadota bacterium]
MVMAAGKGTRMMPLTASTPKPLIAVGGTTLLDHVLDQLRAAGVGRIVVNVHYLADQVERHLAAHAGDFAVTISDERDLLRDTGGGLIKALPLIDADPFLCVNADNWWTDTSGNALQRMAATWDDARMDVLMLVVPFDRAGNTQGTGDFDLDQAGRLSREGPKRARPYVWTGVQMLAKRIVADPPTDVFSTNVFWDRAIAAGRCYGLVHTGAWYDVGYPEAIGLTEAALAGG